MFYTAAFELKELSFSVLGMNTPETEEKEVTKE